MKYKVFQAMTPEEKQAFWKAAIEAYLKRKEQEKTAKRTTA